MCYAHRKRGAARNLIFEFLQGKSDCEDKKISKMFQNKNT